MGTSNPLTPILESLFWTYTHIMCMYMYIYIYTPYMQIPGGLSQRHLLFRCTVYELLHARTFKHDDSTCDPLQVRSSFLCIFCGDSSVRNISGVNQCNLEQSHRMCCLAWNLIPERFSFRNDMFQALGNTKSFLITSTGWLLSLCCNFAYPACLDPNGRTSLGGWNTLQPVMLQPISTAISMLI